MTTAPTEVVRRRALARRFALGGVVVYVLLVGFSLATGDRIESFVKFADAGPVTAHAEQVLGRPVAAASVEGHDGISFWVLARDPLLLDPAQTAPDLSRPTYRAQRVFYPLVTWPWRLGGEEAVLWGLVVMNLVAVFLGGYWAALLAFELRAPPPAALAFALNPVVLVGVLFDLAEPWAIASVVGMVLFVRRREWALATALAVVAALTKESSLLAVAGVAVFLAGAPVRRRVTLVAVPAAAGVAWAVYVRWRLGWPASEVGELTAVPLRGWIDAYRGAWSEPGGLSDGVVALVVAALSIAVVVRWWRRRTPELSAALPVALLSPFLAATVLHRGIDSLRTTGLMVTLLALDVAAGREQPTASAPRAAEAAPT